jgi:hypothetical protein
VENLPFSGLLQAGSDPTTFEASQHRLDVHPLTGFGLGQVARSISGQSEGESVNVTFIIKSNVTNSAKINK